jgi:hypothetical protein
MQTILRTGQLVNLLEEGYLSFLSRCFPQFRDVIISGPPPPKAHMKKAAAPGYDNETKQNSQSV